MYLTLIFRVESAEILGIPNSRLRVQVMRAKGKAKKYIQKRIDEKK